MIVKPLFQTLAALNVITYMLGSWGFNVIVKTLKGLEQSDWNSRMVTIFLLQYGKYNIDIAQCFVFTEKGDRSDPVYRVDEISDLYLGPFGRLQ